MSPAARISLIQRASASERRLVAARTARRIGLLGIDNGLERAIGVPDGVRRLREHLDHGQPLWCTVSVEPPGQLVSYLQLRQATVHVGKLSYQSAGVNG